MWGYDAHDAPQDAAYDIIVDIEGRVIRIQVKTRSAPQGRQWSYRVMRGEVTGAQLPVLTRINLAITTSLLPLLTVSNVYVRTESRGLNSTPHRGLHEGKFRSEKLGEGIG